MAYTRTPRWKRGVWVLYAKRLEAVNCVRSDRCRICRGESWQRERCEGVVVHDKKCRVAGGSTLTRTLAGYVVGFVGRSRSAGRAGAPMSDGLGRVR